MFEDISVAFNFLISKAETKSSFIIIIIAELFLLGSNSKK